MANDNNALGFVPWGPLLNIMMHTKDSVASSNPVFVGDVAAVLPSGYLTSSDIDSVTYCSGVCLSYVTGGATAGSVMVADDKDQFFHVQGDVSAGTLTIAHVGCNADHTYAAGSVYTKWSAAYLNTQTGIAAAGATAQFRIYGLRKNTNTDGTKNAYGQYSKLIVRPNEHQAGVETGV